MDNQGQQTPNEPSLNEYHIYISEDPRYRATPSLIHKLRVIKKRQYAGILSLVVIVALGGYIIYKIPEYAGDVRTRASEARPKPTPLFCNAKCGAVKYCVPSL